MPVGSNLRWPEISPDRLAALEERVARIEARLGAEPIEQGQREDRVAPSPELALESPAMLIEQGEELELRVGQSWFAVAGVGALTMGAGFLLALPFAALPAGVPSLFGYGVVGVLFVLAHLWRGSFAAVAGYLRGAAMILLCFATLRLFFPAARQVVSSSSWGGHAVLAVMVAINLALAWRRRSAWLMGVALATCGIAALAAGSAGFALGGVMAIAIAALLVRWRNASPGLAMAAMPLAYATYLAWALGNPFFAAKLKFVAGPGLAPVMLLATAVLFALAPLFHESGEDETTGAKIGALLNCALGYGLFLVHTAAAHTAALAPLHLLASIAFLGLGVAYWLHHHSRVATFFYAMTGYVALSVAILKLARGADMFVWLSLQSVVVIATAVLFRSRLIVVANFLIYVGIVLGYVITAKSESGISVGFGVVALVSARILNWQQHRLELKTELMRNAYLVSAFVVFPYALAHLVPGRLVALAWVGLALAYYGMNLMVRSPKYRWMGHATLILTTLYLVMIGISRFEPAYRVLSFFALGVALLIVSLSFTRARKRRDADGERADEN